MVVKSQEERVTAICQLNQTWVEWELVLDKLASTVA
jgi:hypothetical protein